MVWQRICRTKDYTEYCSHRCSGLAYKERKRQAKLSEFKAEYSTQIEGKIEIEKLEFLSPTQVCRLLGVSRATAYRYFADNAIATVPPGGGHDRLGRGD